MPFSSSLAAAAAVACGAPAPPSLSPRSGTEGRREGGSARPPARPHFALLFGSRRLVMHCGRRRPSHPRSLPLPPMVPHFMTLFKRRRRSPVCSPWLLAQIDVLPLGLVRMNLPSPSPPSPLFFKRVSPITLGGGGVGGDDDSASVMQTGALTRVSAAAAPHLGMQRRRGVSDCVTDARERGN